MFKNVNFLNLRTQKLIDEEKQIKRENKFVVGKRCKNRRYLNKLLKLLDFENLLNFIIKFN